MSPIDILEDDWAPAAHVTSRDITEGAILLDMSSGQCWRINATGAALWRSLATATSFKNAILEVAEGINETRERVEADLRKFAEQLVAAGVLVRRSGDRGP